MTNGNKTLKWFDVEVKLQGNLGLPQPITWKVTAYTEDEAKDLAVAELTSQMNLKENIKVSAISATLSFFQRSTR